MGLASLLAHKLRSLLTMLGMIFGVGAVVAMLSITAGAQQEMIRYIDLLGVNNIIVEAHEAVDRDTLLAVRQLSPGLTFRDFRALQENTPNVEAMSPRKQFRPTSVLPKTDQELPVLIGVLPNYTQIYNVTLLEGREATGWFDAPVAQLQREVAYYPESKSVVDTLDELRVLRSHLAVVVDEHGGTAGIITLQDLFEEVVGPVDAREQGAAASTAEEGDRVQVPGTARLDEVGERFSVPLRHPEVDSVSGLVLARLGRPPRVGDVVRFGGLRFEVTKVLGFGVGECAVSRLPPA
jgi:CBS domain containing-hemolysin-like protein